MIYRPLKMLAVGSALAIAMAGVTVPQAIAAPVATETILSDSFDRTVPSGFGNADVGGGYSYSDVRNLSVGSGVGTMALASRQSRSAYLTAVPVADLEATSVFGLDALPTAGSVYFSQMLRATSNGEFLAPRVRVMLDKSIVVGFRHSAAGGRATTIGKDVVLPFKFASTDTRLEMRTQAEGRDLRLKVWKHGAAEPTAWTVVASSSLLTTPGFFGTWAYLGSGTNAIKVSVDDVRVKSFEEPNVLPSASFEVVAVDLVASFDASGSADSDGSIKKYEWDFGDGSSGLGKSASKVFGAGGTYEVSLTVTDDRGGKDSTSRQVTVVPPNVLPSASFAATSTYLTAVLDASGSSDSDGVIAEYRWEFDDGTNASGIQVIKSFETAGTHKVTLTVVDSRGGSAASTQDLTLVAPNQLPTAAFSSTGGSLAADFDATDSNDADGVIMDYRWDFGDGKSGSGVRSSHIYERSGTYGVTLTVTDSSGAVSATSKPVEVQPAANSIAVDSFDRSAVAGWGTANRGGPWSASGTAAQYAVASGMGTMTVPAGRARSQSLNGVSEAYSQLTLDVLTLRPRTGSTYVSIVGRKVSNGNDYRLKLKYLESGELNATISRTLSGVETSLSGGKVAGLTLDSNDVIRIRFHVEGVNGTSLKAKVWKANEPEPADWLTETLDSTATLQTAGSLALSTYVGGSVSNAPLTVKFDNVDLVPSPNIAPTARIESSVSDLSALFNGASSGDPDGVIGTYAWDFGDGATSTGETAAHKYGEAGTYEVRLTVTDNRGSSSSTAKSVSVAAPATVRPSAANTGVPAGHPLVVHNGDLTITTPGAVIDGLDVRGYVKISAPNVTIRRSILRGPATAPSNSRGLLAITTTNAAGYLIEDVTFLPRISSYNIDGVKVNQPGTFRRVDMSGSVDGLVIYGNGVRVESSYLHDFVQFASDPAQNGGPSHDDAIQVQAGTGVTIVNNTLTGAKNTAVMITQDAGVTRDLTISDNWIDGGWCSLNFKSNGGYKTGIRVNNNKFGRSQSSAGCAITHNSQVSDLVPVGNVWEDNGQPVGVRPRA